MTGHYEIIMRRSVDGAHDSVMVDRAELEEAIAEYIRNCGFSIFGRSCDPHEESSVVESSEHHVKTFIAALERRMSIEA